MATNKINVVEKTPGTHIEYALSGSKKITFGDDELTINLASRERDFEVSAHDENRGCLFQPFQLFYGYSERVY